MCVYVPMRERERVRVREIASVYVRERERERGEIERVCAVRTMTPMCEMELYRIPISEQVFFQNTNMNFKF